MPLTTHRATHTPEFRAWQAMKSRCANPRSKSYKDYGGRGITFCDRWKSFQGFFEDMGMRPVGGTLERIDNNAGYGPSNCRWATPAEQGVNKRNNRRLTFNGETLTLSQWVRRTGIAKNTLRNRLAAGWPIEIALTRGFSQGQRNVIRNERAFAQPALLTDRIQPVRRPTLRLRKS